jgi:phenylacetate-CoA ligase
MTSAVSRDAAALAALRGLLVELRDKNPFYIPRLREVSPPMPSSLADFAARFPLTSKAELVADAVAHPPYGSARSEPLARFTRCHQTSGTTGTPLRWLDTPESWSGMTDDWVEVLRQAGVTSSDRMLFAFSFGPFLGFWLAFAGLAHAQDAAEVSVRVNRMENQIRQLSGQIEQLQFENRRLTEQLKRFQAYLGVFVLSFF